MSDGGKRMNNWRPFNAADFKLIIPASRGDLLEYAIKACNDRISPLQNQIDHLRTKIAGFYDGTALGEIRYERDKLKEENLSLKKDNAKLSLKRDSLMEYNAKLRSDFDELKKELHKTRPISDIEAENAWLKSRLSNAEVQITYFEDTNEYLNNQVTFVESELSKLKKEIENAAVRIEEIKK